jgi:hypothetical protein
MFCDDELWTGKDLWGITTTMLFAINAVLHLPVGKFGVSKH